MLDVEYTSQFPLESIKKRGKTLWRYREAIPVLYDKNIISFNEGFTPIIKDEIEDKTVHFKLEYLFPSGSYKDRGATVMISKAKEQGVERLVEDSSGNAGSAVAAYCARACIECEIFVPAYASQGKIIQIKLYGATLHTISGTREDTADAALKAAEKKFYGSHVWNPYFLQGTKTFAFETIEQMEWDIPDTIIMPLGHGGLILGTFMGLEELFNAGLIDEFPRLIGVQSESCAPLAEAYRKRLNDYVEIEKKDTIAEGVMVKNPLRAPQILDAVRRTDGEIITVSEDEIKEALKIVQKKGYYIEPTSATAVAAIKEKANGTTLIPLTGHGLKSTYILEKIFS
jgi:threonine synthase